MGATSQQESLRADALDLASDFKRRDGLLPSDGREIVQAVAGGEVVRMRASALRPSSVWVARTAA